MVLKTSTHPLALNADRLDPLYKTLRFPIRVKIPALSNKALKLKP